METENLEIINNPLIDEAAKIKKISIVGIVLIFTIIGFFVTIIISIILGIKIISTDWKNQEINNDKLLWGLLTLLLLGPISSLIFANITLDKLNNDAQIQ